MGEKAKLGFHFDLHCATLITYFLSHAIEFSYQIREVFVGL